MWRLSCPDLISFLILYDKVCSDIRWYVLSKQTCALIFWVYLNRHRIPFLTFAAYIPNARGEAPLTSPWVNSSRSIGNLYRPLLFGFTKFTHSSRAYTPHYNKNGSTHKLSWTTEEIAFLRLLYKCLPESIFGLFSCKSILLTSINGAVDRSSFL